MKTLITLMLISISLFAKTQPPPPGSYITNNNLDKFVGTWKWTDNVTNSEVIVKLKKIQYYWTNMYYNEDILVGCHSYKQNGIMIENNLSLYPNLGQNQTGSILVWGILNGSEPNFVKGSLTNLTKNKDEYLQFNYLNTNPPTIDWYLSEGDEVTSFVLVGANPPDPSINAITLPHKIILVKQP